jgi:hypothetical protein
LTSSHSNQPAKADWISWCLSRDRKCQRRDDPKAIARTPPPAFLFPNLQCQRPRPACRPRRLAPGVGGGGYLVASVFRVNRPFRAFFSRPEDPVLKSDLTLAEAGLERKNHCGLPRGFPHGSVAIRLKDRKLHAEAEKIKGFLSRWSSSPRRFRPESGVFMGRRSPCQSTFRSVSFGSSSEDLETKELPPPLEAALQSSACR